MKNSKKLQKLDTLTEVLLSALKPHEHKEGMCSIVYLLGIIRKKFDKIRIFF